MAPALLQGQLSLDRNEQSTLESKVSVTSENAGLISDANRLEAIYQRIGRRVLSIFVITIFLNHIDRTNLAYAALTMNKDLGFDPRTYGLGSALFFVTFCIFQVPSNLIMLRVGIRRWLPFLLIAWGCVASCFALIHNAASFFILRLLLGVFEAGALPAMWWHLSQFMPQERLTKPYMWITVGVLLSQILGGPLAAGFLAMDGLGGLQGWQWLFMLEGLPSVVMGVVVFLVLPSSYTTAKWLTESEKALLAADMAEHIKNSPAREDIPRNPITLLKMVGSNPLLVYICLVGILQACTSHTFILWLPTIIEALINGRALGVPAGHSVKSTPSGTSWRGVILPVLLTCIPYTAGAISAFVVASSSQKRKEVYFHAAGSMMVAGIFFVLFPVLAKAAVAAGFVSLVLVAAAGSAAASPKVALVAHICRGPSQVVGMPMYNSVAVIGGFIGPFLTGAIVQSSGGGFKVVSIVLGCMTISCGIAIAALKYIEPCVSRHTNGAGSTAAADAWVDCEQDMPSKREASGPSGGSSGFAGDLGKNVDVLPATVRARPGHVVV